MKHPPLLYIYLCSPAFFLDLKSSLQTRLFPTPPFIFPMPYVSSKSSTQPQRVATGAGGCAAVRCTAHALPEAVAKHHEHEAGPDQCCSAVVQTVAAPAAAVWSVVRRFDRPQAYKHFVKSCRVVGGNGGVGTLREVRVVSGLPAVTSTERLEVLDDEHHVLSFRVVGGEHRLANYRSVTTLHPVQATAAEGGERTAVVESYVVDVPPGNSKEDTRAFVDTIIKCNLHSLARTAEELYRYGGSAAGAPKG